MVSLYYLPKLFVSSLYLSFFLPFLLLCLCPSLSQFVSFTPCDPPQSLQPPLRSPPPHGQTQWPRLPASFDVSDVTPALWMPLHRQSYPLSEKRYSPQRGPVINPVQPRPLLHCLNTWCITTPIPTHPPRFTQTCMCGREPMMQQTL